MCDLVGIYFSGAETAKNDLKNTFNRMQVKGKIFSRTGKKASVIVGCAHQDNQANVYMSSDGLLAVMYVGYVSNIADLENDLKTKGGVMQSGKEAEVLMRLYETYGDEFVAYLDGVFAVCLVDCRGNSGCPKIILGHDQYGGKPIYFYKNKNFFVFSTGLQAILKCVGKQKLSAKAIASYLKYRFVANPLTPFENIYKLKPLHFLELNGKVRKCGYMRHFESCVQSQNLYEIIQDSVRRNLSENFETGIFLSGGLDSSVVACLAAQMNRQIIGYTIKYENFSLNEDLYTNQIGKKYKQITNQYLCADYKKQDWAGVINQVVEALEEPIYSTVSVSTYLLAREATKKSRYVLTGDGSDELFMSYKYLSSSYAEKKQVISYQRKIGWLSEKMKYLLFDDQKIFNKIKLIAKKGNIIDTFRHFELKYRLPDYHLARVDKLTKANYLEARVPFLSASMLNFCNQLDFEQILQNRDEKTLLKQTFKNILPDVVYQREKQPFTAPYQEWIDGVLLRDIERIFKNHQYCRKFGIRYEALNQLIDKKDKDYFDYTAIWGIYILFKWYEAYKKYIY